MANVVRHYNCHDNIGPTALISAWTEAAIATLVVTVRFVTAILILRKLGTDDWIMLVALLTALLNTSLITHSVRWGLGHHWECLDNLHRMEAMKWEFAAQPAGIMTAAFARISFCVYVMRFIGFSKWKKWFLWGLVAGQLIVNGWTVLEVLVQCDHIPSLWDPTIKGSCWSPKVQAYTGYVQGGWNGFTDLACAVVPIFIVWKLNMKTSTRVALSILMGMSVFAMIVCIVKSVYLQYIGERMDFTWDTVNFVIWFSVENYVVIITASIPTIRPLFLWINKRRHPSQASQQVRSGNSSKPPPDPGLIRSLSMKAHQLSPDNLVASGTSDASGVSQYERHFPQKKSRPNYIKMKTSFSMASTQTSPMAEYDPRTDFPFSPDMDVEKGSCRTWRR